MAMDKNVVNYMREDARTLRVSFKPVTPDQKLYPESAPDLYLYCTNDATIVAGDMVVVPTYSKRPDQYHPFSLVEVVQVHDDVQIEPGYEHQIRWIVGKVDFTEYFANIAKNEEIQKVLDEGYKQNIRRSFSQQVMMSLPEEAAAKLQNILAAPAKLPDVEKLD